MGRPQISSRDGMRANRLRGTRIIEEPSGIVDSRSSPQAAAKEASGDAMTL